MGERWSFCQGPGTGFVRLAAAGEGWQPGPGLRVVHAGPQGDIWGCWGGQRINPFLPLRSPLLFFFHLG